MTNNYGGQAGAWYEDPRVWQVATTMFGRGGTDPSRGYWWQPQPEEDDDETQRMMRGLLGMLLQRRPEYQIGSAASPEDGRFYVPRDPFQSPSYGRIAPRPTQRWYY